MHCFATHFSYGTTYDADIVKFLLSQRELKGLLKRNRNFEFFIKVTSDKYILFTDNLKDHKINVININISRCRNEKNTMNWVYFYMCIKHLSSIMRCHSDKSSGPILKFPSNLIFCWKIKCGIQGYDVALLYLSALFK